MRFRTARKKPWCARNGVKSPFSWVREWGLGNRSGAKVVSVVGVVKMLFSVSIPLAATIWSFNQPTALALRFSYGQLWSVSLM